MTTPKSHCIVKIIELACSAFEITPTSFLTKKRDRRIVWARFSVYHGMVTSNHFTMNDVSRCFCINPKSVRHALESVNDAIVKPQDAIDVLTYETSALIVQHLLKDHVSTRPSELVRSREQVIIPVVRPEWDIEEATRCSHSGIVLNEGFLVLLDPARMRNWPDALQKIFVKGYNWKSDYVWVKPRIL